MAEMNDPAVTQDAPEGAAGTNTRAKKPASRKAAERGVSQNEPQYSAEDLAKAARTLWGVPPEIVIAAMRMAGMQKVTPAEAQKIITEFITREVK